MRVPTSTYRLQLRAGFGFERAAAIVPYLAALGAGDVYASPILAATRGSPHGYDGTDPSRIDDERGGEAGWQALVTAVHAHGMGLLVDLVPNHLATSDQNRLVVGRPAARPRITARGRVRHRLGRARTLGGKLLVPVLGGPLDEVLDAGELTLDDADPRGSVVRYYERAFPVAAGTEALPLRELLAAQHYGSPTGATPPNGSTTGGSSTSPISSRCVRRTRTSSRPPTARSCSSSTRGR